VFQGRHSARIVRRSVQGRCWEFKTSISTSTVSSVKVSYIQPLQVGWPSLCHQNIMIFMFWYYCIKNEELVLNYQKTKPTTFFSHVHCNVEKFSEYKGVRAVCLVVKVLGLLSCLISTNCMKWMYTGEFFTTWLLQRSCWNIIWGRMRRKLSSKFDFGLY